MFGTTVFFCPMQALLPQPFPPFAKAGGDDSPQEGIMVAFMLPAAVAEALGTWAAEAGIAPEEAVPTEVLHLTLVYVGKVSDIPAEKQAEVRGRLLRVVQEVADLHLPLTGKVNGHGIFVNEDERAYWAAFDSPHLPALRQELVGKLNGTGVPISLLHGFTPHITLAYLPTGREMPQDIPPAADLTFETLAVAWGGEVIEIQPRPVNTSKSQRWDEKSFHAWQIIMSNSHTPTTKALTMPELAQRAIMAIARTMMGTAKENEWVLDDIYPTYAIVILDGTFYRVDFTVDGNTVSVPKRRDWVEVTREWVEDKTPSVVFDTAESGDMPTTTLSVNGDMPTTVLKVTGDEGVSVSLADLLVKGFEPQDNLPTPETLVMEGGVIKSMGVSEDGEYMTLGGYLVRFTGPDQLDSYGHYFTKDTDFGPLRQTVVYYDHAQDPTLKGTTIGKGGVGELTIDDEGVWFETQVSLRKKFERQVARLGVKGDLGLSSGTAPHLVEFAPAPTGKGMHIKTWILGIDASFTVRPAAGTSLTQVTPIKSYTPRPFVKAVAELLDEEEEAHTNPVDSHTEAQGTQARPQDGAQAHVEAPPSASAAEPQGVVSGNPNGGAVEASQSNTDLEDNEMGDLTLDEITKAIQTAVTTATQDLRAEVKTIKTALENEPPINDPGHAVPPTKSATPPHLLRYNSPELALKQAQRELVGSNDEEWGFEQFNLDQSRTLVKALRAPSSLTTADHNLLSTQVYPPFHLKMLLASDMSVRAIKDMQQLSQGTLNGYAMPPMMQEAIVTALPGLTVMRGNGAEVITLQGGSTTYTINRAKNNSEKYANTLRGGWSSETGPPQQGKIEMEEVDIKASVYLYKVEKTWQEMQVANLTQLLTTSIIDAFAADEDKEYIVGTGVGGPLGVLPGGANSLLWKEVVSGAADALTAAGIRKLKRGLPSQYRKRGIFVANNDTYSDLDNMSVSGTGSDLAFPSLSENDMLLRAKAAESPDMPDVAANAYPMLFMDPRGYTIVEVPGMVIQRMQDTITSINKLQIHVMKLVGARPTKPWCFVVQKVAAS